jgi:small-conductance mechanosensitive channel
VDEELLDACGADPRFACEWVFERTDNESLATLSNWLVDRPLRIVLIAAVAWLINMVMRRVVGRGIDQLMFARSQESDFVRATRERAGLVQKPSELSAELQERSKQRAQTVSAVLRSTITILIYGFAAMLILGELNINLGPLIAGAGIAGIAVGFGAQSLVKDFLAGLFILLEDQYGVGDIVDLGPAVGTVEQISLRSTRIRDLEGTVWVVPNGEVQRVGNLSQLWAQSVLDIEVAYDTDIRFATQVIQRVADEAFAAQLEYATILEAPNVLGVQALGSNAVAIRLAVKTEASEQWAVGRHLRQAIKEAFDEEGIDIPFPQRTVWLNTVTDSDS